MPFTGEEIMREDIWFDELWISPEQENTRQDAKTRCQDKGLRQGAKTRGQEEKRPALPRCGSECISPITTCRSILISESSSTSWRSVTTWTSGIAANVAFTQATALATFAISNGSSSAASDQSTRRLSPRCVFPNTPCSVMVNQKALDTVVNISLMIIDKLKAGTKAKNTARSTPTTSPW